MLFGAAVNVDNPRGVSSRFLANIWALFAVVFTASYTANLAAFMITKEDYDKLTGIQDWRLTNPTAHKPPFKYATVRHGSTWANLENNHPDMFTYMQPYNKSHVLEGIKAVKEGEINAFLYDATVLEYLAGQDEDCNLRTVGNWYATTGYGVAFPRGSKWIDRINKHLLEFQSQGELERLQRFWLAGACREKNEEGEKSQPLGILNFTSAFILLAGGMLLGALLLLMEHLYFRFFRTRLRRCDKHGCCSLVSLSVGQSLTFRQSVREAMNLQKFHKCKNPICETQMWKDKRELDLALMKIDRLRRLLGQYRYRSNNSITPTTPDDPIQDSASYFPKSTSYQLELDNGTPKFTRSPQTNLKQNRTTDGKIKTISPTDSPLFFEPINPLERTRLNSAPHSPSTPRAFSRSSLKLKSQPFSANNHDNPNQDSEHQKDRELPFHSSTECLQDDAIQLETVV